MEDCSKEDELKPGSASHIKSSEQSSPRSSDELEDLEETGTVVCKNELIVSRAKHSSSSKADGREYSGPRSPPDGRVPYVSR